MFMMPKKWKQPESPSIDGCMHNPRDSHTVEYYSAMKRKEVLMPAATYMNFGNVAQSGGSQSQKATYCRSPFR